MFILPSVLFLSFVFHAQVVNSASVPNDDPEEYFGGTDHSAYLNWYTFTGQDTYTMWTYLPNYSDRSQGAAIHWKLANNNTEIHLAVAARATGWVGFGLTEPGGMKGADIVIYESAQPDTLIDVYVLEEPKPLIDDCQDWKFVNSVREGGFIIFEGIRKLDTEDYQDRPIWDDSDFSILAQRVIAAWGDDKTFTYHGRGKARGSLRWFRGGDEVGIFRESMKTQSDGYFDLKVNHTLQPIVTDYVSFCFNWDFDITKQGIAPDASLTVVGMESIFSDSRPYVHHATLQPSSQQKALGNGQCEEGHGGHYLGFLYVYTPGTKLFTIPEYTGITFGPGPDGDGLNQSFRLVIHYHNPDLVENVIDTGGIRVYYTNTPREHEIGILPLADLETYRRGETFGATGEVSEYVYDCPEGCSQFVLDKPVTVIGEFFHMHEMGKAAYHEQIRDGQVIHKSHAEFFDFDQAGHLGIRLQPYEVLPGDGFRSACIYDGADSRVFGDASDDEMCLIYLLYYPAQRFIGDIAPWVCQYNLPFTPCAATGEDPRILSAGETFPRSFGSTKDQCAALPGEVENKNDDVDKDDEDSSTTSYESMKTVFTGMMALAALF